MAFLLEGVNMKNMDMEEKLNMREISGSKIKPMNHKKSDMGMEEKMDSMMSKMDEMMSMMHSMMGMK